MKKQEENFKKLKLSGIGMLIFNLVFLVAIIVAFTGIADSNLSSVLFAVLITANSILSIINIIFYVGFVHIEPNEAQVLIFFGKYEGTIKENGFFWVNPFYTKKKLTLRARNLDAEPIKVNDKKGNPVMIGQVLVWRVADTYKGAVNKLNS
jgi:regulator of protease activity HflC (stomatin/prohibitin superfamily)